MAFQVKKGSFQCPTSTGTFPVTGVGFQPKALILFGSRTTATGFAVNRFLSFGFSDGTNDRVFASTGIDGSTTATNVAARAFVDTAILRITTYAAGSETDEVVASLDTFDSNGFTLNFTTAGVGFDYFVHYLALGGSDLTNVFAGTISTPTAGNEGNTDHTGFGFQPDFIMTTTMALTALGVATGGRYAIGAGVSSSQRVSMLVTDEDLIPTQVGSKQISTQLVDWTNATGTILLAGDLTSFISDGVRINWTTLQATSRFVFVLALKGGQYYVGTDTQKTSTGTQSKTVGFLPTGLLLMGTNRASSTSFDATLGKMTMGASDGTTDGCMWGESTDNVSTTDENQAFLTTKVFRHASNPSTTDAEAELSTFNSDGYTLDWTAVNEATAKEFNVIAFGSSAAGAAISRKIRHSRSLSW